MSFAVDRPDTYELYLDAIAPLDPPLPKTALLANPAQAVTLVEAMAKHVHGDRGQWPSFAEANRTLYWLLWVSDIAAHAKRWDLLEAAMRSMCTWDSAFDQWKPQDVITLWLRTLSGHAAQIAASALRAFPDSARHYHDLVDERRVDPAIRQAIHAVGTRPGLR